jgi:hypothetical protein
VAVQALNEPKHTEQMLRALMLSQLPVPAYRASLRRSTDAAAALRILTVVLKWVRSWEKRRVESLKAWVSNVDAVERGEKTLESIKVKPAKGPIPDLELVSVFADTCLSRQADYPAGVDAIHHTHRCSPSRPHRARARSCSAFRPERVPRALDPTAK